MAAIAGALIAGGAALASGALQSGLSYSESVKNRHLQEQNLEYQKALNEKIMQREDTAVQRRVEDLKKAGLSPLLGANGAGAGGTIQATTAPQQNTDYSGIGMAGQNFANSIQAGLELSETAQHNRAMQNLEMDKLQLETDKENWEVHFKNLEEAHKLTNEQQRQQALNDENKRFNAQLEESKRHNKETEKIQQRETLIKEKESEVNIKDKLQDMNQKEKDRLISNFAGVRSTDQLSASERDTIQNEIEDAYYKYWISHEKAARQWIANHGDPQIRGNYSNENMKMALDRVSEPFEKWAIKYMKNNRMKNTSGKSSYREGWKTYVPSMIPLFNK